MGRLDNKVVLISGGARGQGAFEAKMFTREGAKVVFGDILDEEGKGVEREIIGMGGQATYVHLDVTKEEDWNSAVALTESQYGKLDVLVNNAGVTIGKRGIEDTTVGDWDHIMEVNVKGVFLGTKYAIPAMRRAGGGSIVNISSTAGIVAIGRSAAYNATKGAVRVFTKATAIQHAKDKIRCNSVHPGPIDTPFLQGLTDNPVLLAERLKRVPLGRIGIPEDVAYGVLYLASDESSYVTGSELVIDGGSTAE